MQKINNASIFVSIALFLTSCGGGFKYTTIFKEEGLKISYIDSRKIGKRINSNLIIENQIFEYNIYIGYKGLPIHIIRYAPQPVKIKNKTRLDTYREMEFLITDTTKNTPNYVGNEINGYYDPTFFKGRYEVEKLKKIISPVSAKEYEMLQKIKEILITKQVEFMPIDSAKIMGWFKYDF
jgi:glycogen debranching enzyme